MTLSIQFALCVNYCIDLRKNKVEFRSIKHFLEEGAAPGVLEVSAEDSLSMKENIISPFELGEHLRIVAVERTKKESKMCFIHVLS